MSALRWALPLLLVPCASAARTFDATVYGAKGDGRADDSSAIAAAIAAAAPSGGKVYLPAGRYRARVVLRSGVELFGDGPGATVVAAPPPEGKADSYALFGRGVENAAVRDLSVAADSSKTPWPAGIRFAASSGVRISRVAVSGSVHGQGIVFDEAPGFGSDNVVEGCTVRDSEQGIVVDNEDVRVIGNLVEGCKYGISLEYATPHAAVVADNVVDARGRSGSFGIVATKADHAVVSANVVRRAWLGVYVKERSSRLTLTGNRVYETAGAGIQVEESSAVVVTGNSVDGAGGAGIRLDGVEASDVSANSVSGAGGDGIVSERGEGNDLSGNSVRGTAGDGIRTVRDASPVHGNSVRGAGRSGVARVGADASATTGNVIHLPRAAGSRPEGGVALERSRGAVVSGNHFSGELGSPAACGVVLRAGAVDAVVSGNTWTGAVAEVCPGAPAATHRRTPQEAAHGR